MAALRFLSDDSCPNLKKSIPLLNELFHIHCKIGEGTFSSVFLATVKSSNRHKKFALKHLIPTCHPERIERELQCLQQMGGKDHIVSIDLCLRHHGSVVFVMPYMKHDKFSEYVKDMTVEETKDYMRALLSAVRRVHQFNIIHRDVKPSNFLYNRANRKYLLVDFGLAQQCTEYNAKNLEAIKTNAGTTEIQSMKRKRSDELNLNAKKDADTKCNCFGKPKVCALCLTRPQQTAPRAGTPGFRAPEVLLKHPSQTPASCNKRASELLRQVNDRVDAIIKTEWTRTAVSDTLTDTSIDMVETTTPTQATDGQTQFGNARHLDPSDCIFVFKNTLSDYEEPPSDEEVDLKPLREATVAVPAPKITEKRKAEDADASKDLKKAKLETKALKAKRPGFTDERYNETSYYVEHGLRKVYPYYFTFTTFTKGRWVGEKILEVFAREFRAHPAEEYERCIRAGTLTVNYQKVDVDYRLRHNDLLANVVHRHEVPVTSEPITVIHMDEDVVVVNKPASIPVHPCGRYRHNTVVFILAKEYNLKNLRTIHRLDRLTSGILLFGRTPKKARQMEHQIRNRQVHKQYVCRVEGEFPEEEVICSEPIEVVSYKIGVCKVSEKGKDCVTRFKRLSYNGKSSVVLCKPQTGRMHQIRVHLQYLGYPVVNDPLYNHVVFGPHKGKGGNIGKTDEELVRDLISIHNAENWLGMDGDSDMSLFKPKLELEERVLGSGTDKDNGSSPSSTPGLLEDEQQQPQQQPQQQESLKVTVGTQTGSEPPDSTFANDKVTVDPHCYECKVKYRDPKPSDLVMYLHAWRYCGPGWEYETPLPAWAASDWTGDDR